MIKFVVRLAQILHFNVLSQCARFYNLRSMTVSNLPSMIVSPHQDDETFGCGGLIALKKQLGVRVAVVFLTDGGGTSTTRGYQEHVTLRQQEAIEALSILGVSNSDIYFQNYPDGRLQALSESEQQSLESQLQEIIERYEAQEVYVPHCKDGHCDHEAAFQVVKTAIAQLSCKVQIFQYPIWLFWKRPFLLQIKRRDLAGAYRLNISPVKTKKQAAIQVYQSQLPILPFGFLIPYQGSTELFFDQQSDLDNL